MGVGAEAAHRLRPGGAIPRAGLRALCLALLCLSGLCLGTGQAAAARLVSASGSEPEAYGRIVLTFDAPVSLKAKVSGTILVLSFGETVSAGPERIAVGMPNFVSAVRRDPDGSAFRLALQRPLRVNVQDAGEQVYVDLLPESWTGLPPQLPAEVVADLARRARVAEAALKARNPAPAPRVLPIDLARGSGRVRVAMRLPADAAPAIEATPAAARVALPGAWRLDDRGLRGRLDPAVGRIEVENLEGRASLTATPAAGYAVAAERDTDGVFVDFTKIARDKPARETAAKPNPAVPAEAQGHAETASAGASEPTPVPAAVQAAKPDVEPAPVPRTVGGEDGSVRSVRPEAPPRRAGSGLVFPFRKPVPAALFERAGVVTAVFETPDAVTVPPSGETGFVALGPAQRRGSVAVVRFTPPSGKLVDLVAITEPAGWELVAADDIAPSEGLSIQRKPDAQGRFGIGVRLPDPGGAAWLDLDGERVAVVTAAAGRRAGVVRPQRFVDFELLASRVGLAVLALADDLAVRPDLDGVAIERGGGMAISGVSRPAEPPVGPVGDLVIDRAAWEEARRGDVSATLRARVAAAVAAPRGERGAARLAHARALMANGLDAEAKGALDAAASEDPVIESERSTVLMRGILAARLGRIEDARRILTAGVFSSDPEARLWRGFAEAATGRWSDADAALRAGEAVLDRYPDDLASLMRTTAAEAAAEVGDHDNAARLAIAATRGASDGNRDRLALLRARTDEATGRREIALEAYETLAAGATRPVAAAATLRAALLARSLGKSPPPETIARLEGLALTWHGGATELETLASLGNLYADAGRWRQVFLMARRADALAPDAVPTRALHEQAQALFEDLFLGARAERVTGVEGLALYFDFKDFAPAGRRADEIVRRLADRLVALDLLDSAGELLQHQIERRLTGPARAGVSARLATIRLMEGKPLDALQTLDATHLPELPEDLRRARALLRARALSDLTRTDLALETIEGETGAEAARLRADILWSARRWRDAGEAHEALLGETWRAGRPLDEAARADVTRAGIAYGLAGETLGLERLKAKFAAPMAETADARTFALLTRADAARNPAFREIARRASTAETLAAFLAEYRKRYPDAAVPPRGTGDAPPADPPPEGTRPQAEAQGAKAPPG